MSVYARAAPGQHHQGEVDEFLCPIVDPARGSGRSHESAKGPPRLAGRIGRLGRAVEHIRAAGVVGRSARLRLVDLGYGMVRPGPLDFGRGCGRLPAE